MECFYINLEKQADRREAIERNFQAHRIEGWNLHRFEAVNTADVERLGTPGTLSAGAKACFLSHRDLIRSAQTSNAPIMIVEDDAIFGPETCRAIEVSLETIDEADWDIVFTDVCVGDVGTWRDFIGLRREFEQSRELKFFDLSRLHFSGSSAYILSPKFMPLLSKLLDGAESLDAPYDLYLRLLVRQFKLRASVIVPFVTSISDLAEQSSIQTQELGPIGIMNLFRRMVWMDRDLSKHTEAIRRLRAAYSTEETLAFSALFEALISERMSS
jgi:GR25 family glycosyltransferase involved in LPS biosynthesis